MATSRIWTACATERPSRMASSIWPSTTISRSSRRTVITTARRSRRSARCCWARTGPFVITSGTAIAANVDGKPSTENGPTASWNPRAASEAAVKELTARGVNTSVVRLPQVHDTRKQGLVPYVHAVAREKRLSAYIGDGGNRWPAAHVSDVARLYRLAIEKAEPGAIYHAVDEEGVSMKAIAEALGRGLKVPVLSIKPEEAEAHFGWLARFAGHDMPASSALTQQKLNWKPTGPGLIADLDGMDYTQA